MAENNKQEVIFPSSIIEKDILDRCASPGIHITNPYTGLGKSYALSHAAVNGLLEQFARVVYVVPQLKLRDEGVEGVMKHVRNKPDIEESDVLVLRSKIGNFTEIEEPETLLEKFTEEFSSILNKVADNDLSDMDCEAKAKCIRTIGRHRDDLMKRVRQFAAAQARLAGNIEDDFSLNQELFEITKKGVEDCESIFCKTVCDALTILRHLVKSKCGYYELYQKLRSLVATIYPEVKIENKRIIIVSASKLVQGLNRRMTGYHSIRELDGRTVYIMDESDACYDFMAKGFIEASLSRNAVYDLYSLCFTIIRMCSENNFRIHKEFPLYKDVLQVHSKIMDRMNAALHGMNMQQLFPKTIFKPDKQKRLSRKKALFMVSGANYFYIGGEQGGINVTADESQQAVFFKELPQAENNDADKGSTGQPAGTDAVKVSSFARQLSYIVGQASWDFLEIAKKLQRLRQANMEKLQEGRAGSSNFYIQGKDDTIESCVDSLIHLYNITGEVLTERLKRLYYVRLSRMKISKSPLADNSVYNRGFQVINITNPEQSGSSDETHFDLAVCEMRNTPEGFLLSLLPSNDKEKDDDTEDSRIYNTVILSSATAESRCLRRNWALPYVRRVIGDFLTFPKKEFYNEIKKAASSLLNPNRKPIECESVADYYDEKTWIALPDENGNIDYHLPGNLRNMVNGGNYNPATIETWWSKVKDCFSRESGGRIIPPSVFDINRFLKFVEAFHNFWYDEDLDTMIYFMNKLVKGNEKRLYMWTAALIEGSWEEEKIGDIPNIQSCSVFCSNDDKAIRKRMDHYTACGKRGKLCLVSAYASISAGVNYKFKIIGNECPYRGYAYPGEEVSYMDWNCVYLEKPMNYTPVEKDDKVSGKFHDFNIGLMWLASRWLAEGLMSTRAVHSLVASTSQLNDIRYLDNRFNNSLERASFMLSTLEQAVGRIVRTNNKGRQTKIFWDANILTQPMYEYRDVYKAYSPEFEVFLESVHPANAPKAVDLFNLPDSSESADNMSHNLKVKIDYRMKQGRAARTLTRLEESDEESHVQEMIAEAKLFLLRNPTIDSACGLPRGMDRVLPELAECYRKSVGRRPEYTSGNITINEGYTRLDVFMKVPCIKQFFEDMGFATSWNEGDYIMQPSAVQQLYMGEVGEQAFLAILRAYAGVEMEKLPRQLWEHADFLYRRLAFDVKNYNPTEPYVGEMAVGPHYADKVAALQRDLFIVQMLPYAGRKPFKSYHDWGADGHHLYEVNGIIDMNGNIIHKNVEKIIGFIKGVRNE